MNVRSRALLLTALVTGAAMITTACAKKSADQAADQPASKTLVVYSARNEKLVQPIIDAFQAQTGIQVTLRSGGSGEIVGAILEEKASPKADVVLINDAGALGKLRLEGALQPNDSAKVAAIPSEFRAADGSWTGITTRARVIMYNKALVNEADLPRSIFDLADPKWKGQVAMANGANDGVIGNITQLRLAKGDDFTRDFLKRLKDNGVVLLKGHTEVRQAVGKGEFKLGWVNSYYYHLQTKEPTNNNVGVVYPDQGPNDIGAAYTISGAGLIKGAPNEANARAFIDFLLSPEAQKLYAEVNFEMPLVPGVPVAEGVRPLSDYKLIPVSQQTFGAELDKTTKLIEEVGLLMQGN